MGTYLSKPDTATISDGGKSRSLSFGVSSMQGWRVTQEDAHVCLLNFDDGTEETSLFGVFDGHGGAEVAEYAAKHLPLWIKKSEYYSKGDLERALSDSFLAFDQSLVEPHVLQILKDMVDEPASDDEDDKINEAIALQEEAAMPIDQLLSKYGCVVLKKEDVPAKASGDSPGTSGDFSFAASKPVIPNESVNGDATDQNGSEVKLKDKALKVSTNEPIEDVTAEAEEVPLKAENGSGKIENGSEKVDKESDATKDDVANGDREPIGNVKLRVDKGKGKKIITPKRVETEEKKPLYEKFVEEEDYDEDDSDGSDSDEEEDDDEDSSEDEEDEIDEEDDDDHEISMGLGEVPGKDSGCTACVALVRGNLLLVANAGDSRCVVSRAGSAIDMSVDHKPEDDVERNRIEKAGGQVTADGRVNGGLNLSRALGDHTYKENTELSLKEQMISPEPDVKKLELTEKDEFFIVACDGIWNSMSSQDVVNFVSERIQNKSLMAICEELFHACLAPDSTGDGTGCDNMTAVIVELKNQNLKRKVDSGKESEEENPEPSKKSKDQVFSSSSSSN